MGIAGLREGRLGLDIHAESKAWRDLNEAICFEHMEQRLRRLLTHEDTSLVGQWPYHFIVCIDYLQIKARGRCKKMGLTPTTSKKRTYCRIVYLSSKENAGRRTSKQPTKISRLGALGVTPAECIDEEWRGRKRKYEDE